ncbi:hypothetical protein L950_0224415 [Sphingobacterium sp. IITKGP-BTPF85]|nr:hypothetical protein L950_0224415 [Sphingobacterium sp. IITKGP-BTPF85]
MIFLFIIYYLYQQIDSKTANYLFKFKNNSFLVS